MRLINIIALKVFIFFIKAYQFCISPYLGANCRFYPTCSEYCVQSVNKLGIKGVFKGFFRLLRCHPFSSGGVDLPFEK